MRQTPHPLPGHDDVPWVHDRAAELRRFDVLLGRSIAGVRYVSLDDDASWFGEPFDSLDFGLDLVLDDGSAWSLAWFRADDEEAVLFRPAAPGNDAGIAAGAVVRDVTDRSGWPAVSGRAIEAVEAAWTKLDGARDSPWCPVTWVLRLAGGATVVVALGERAGDGAYRYSHEDIAVFFDEGAARAAGVLLRSDDAPAPRPGGTPTRGKGRPDRRSTRRA